jgi:hypothetical protein
MSIRVRCPHFGKPNLDKGGGCCTRDDIPSHPQALISHVIRYHVPAGWLDREHVEMLYVLAEFQGTQEARASVSEYGRVARVSEREARRTLRQLESAAWIVREVQPGKPSEYHVRYSGGPIEGVARARATRTEQAKIARAAPRKPRAPDVPPMPTEPPTLAPVPLAAPAANGPRVRRVVVDGIDPRLLGAAGKPRLGPDGSWRLDAAGAEEPTP